jgi:5'(3')-deoxyribonucleotidase
MIIAIDLDDTLAESLQHFIKFYNKKYIGKYGVPIKFKDFTSYFLCDIRNMSREEELKIIKDYDTYHHRDEIEPINKAIEIVKELSKKHEIIIVTSRTKKVEKETRAWVKKYLPMIKEIFFTREDYLDASKPKEDICKTAYADVLIDDSLRHVTGCDKAGIRTILLNRPWNKKKEEEKHVRRVNSWSEVPKIIEEIELELDKKRNPKKV